MFQASFNAPRTEKGSAAQPDGPLHFAFVDSLRGLAILGVICSHVCFCVDNFHGQFRIYSIKGSYGVQLFFIVSAFTLFFSLRSRSQLDRRPICAFFARRFFRIAPLFWAATAFYCWHPDLWRQIEAPDPVRWPQLLTTLLFIHGWSLHTMNSIVPGGWSIADEAMFYLFIPILFRRITKLRSALWLSVVSATLVGQLIPLASTQAKAHYPSIAPRLAHEFIERSFPCQFPVFCLGMVFYFLIVKRADRETPAPSTPQTGGWFFLLLAGCLIFADLPDYFSLSIAFICLAYGLAIYPAPLLVNVATCYLGTISYSLYIWHFLTLQLILQCAEHNEKLHRTWTHLSGTWQFVALLILVMGTSIPLATLSYWLIELPGQNLGKSLIRRMNWGSDSRVTRVIAKVPA